MAHRTSIFRLTKIRKNVGLERIIDAYVKYGVCKIIVFEPPVALKPRRIICFKSNIKTKDKKSKSYLSPKPEPTAMSSRSEREVNVAASSFTTSRTFQMFPISTKNALFREPNRLYRYSALVAIFRLASLNSFRPPLLPGPRE